MMPGHFCFLSIPNIAYRTLRAWSRVKFDGGGAASISNNRHPDRALNARMPS